MIRIDAEIRGTEALVRLDTLPKRIRGILQGKLENFLENKVKGGLLVGTPGRYLDPKYVRTDVTTVGSLLIGTLEADDKPGVYPIFPTKANILRFVAKGGDIIFTKRVLLHPFPKGAPAIERYFMEHKPWLLDQIEDLVFEAVYNAR